MTLRACTLAAVLVVGLVMPTAAGAAVRDVVTPALPVVPAGPDLEEVTVCLREGGIYLTGCDSPSAIDAESIIEDALDERVPEGPPPDPETLLP